MYITRMYHQHSEQLVALASLLWSPRTEVCMCLCVIINIHANVYVKLCNQMSLYMRPVLSQDVDNLSE